MERDMMGKLVTVTKQYTKVARGSWRKWESVDIEPRQGWIVGYRTIYSGYMDSDIDDYGYRVGSDYFIPDSHHQCALVTFSPRQNAVRVPLDGFFVSSSK